MTDLSGKRVIVTGGAGFVGRVVCDRLRKKGVRDQDLFVPLIERFDLTTEEAARRLYREAFAGKKADIIIHLDE